MAAASVASMSSRCSTVSTTTMPTNNRSHTSDTIASSREATAALDVQNLKTPIVVCRRYLDDKTSRKLYLIANGKLKIFGAHWNNEIEDRLVRRRLRGRDVAENLSPPSSSQHFAAKTIVKAAVVRAAAAAAHRRRRAVCTRPCGRIAVESGGVDVAGRCVRYERRVERAERRLSGRCVGVQFVAGAFVTTPR